MSSFISDIFSKPEYTIKEKMEYVWTQIEERIGKTSMFEVLQNLVSSDGKMSKPNFILYSRKPVNIIIYDLEQDLGIKERSENICIPLTEDNFKLIVKEICFNAALSNDDSALFDPTRANAIAQQIFASV